MDKLKTRKILLVEDNEGDSKLFEEAISINDLSIDLEIIAEGDKAMQYFEVLRTKDKSEFPNLVVLDLNLPKVNGKTILKLIKESEELKSLPTIILTTSNLSYDIDECYALGANAYLPKSFEIDKFFQLIQLMDKFWFRNSLLPSNNS